MSEKNIISNDENINKSSFYRIKKLFIIDDTDVNKILISKKQLYGKKSSLKHFFIGYNNHDGIRLLYLKLPQMIVYV